MEINEIKENSWHFKFHEKRRTQTHYRLYNNQAITLCSYFWSTVGVLLLSLAQLVGWVIGAIGLIFITGALIYLLVIVPLNSLLFIYTGIGYEHKLSNGLVIVLVECIAAILVGIVTTLQGDMEVCPKWLKLPKFDKDTKIVENKTPNLLLEYMKAKKAKVCPLVQLKRE